MHCRIPQEGPVAKHNNIVHSELAMRGQTDWAVLCSHNYQTRLIIFWGGSNQCSGNLNLHPDINDLQGESEPTDQIYYNRRIEVIAPKQMAGMILNSAEYEGLHPRTAFTHFGILDGTDKMTDLHYCDGHVWHKWNFAE